MGVTMSRDTKKTKRANQTKRSDIEFSGAFRILVVRAPPRYGRGTAAHKGVPRRCVWSGQSGTMPQSPHAAQQDCDSCLL